MHVFSSYWQQEEAFGGPVMWLWASNHYFRQPEEGVWRIGKISGENGGIVYKLDTTFIICTNIFHDHPHLHPN